ncbi:MAG TPA: DUF418 domain-containing protein [Croceibacterium sp.]|nr:DUF418 domain-containing protein [Croceibacterium sp.]
MNATQVAGDDTDLALAGATPDQPVDAGERIVALDFVRGVAVLGILFPNIVAYANPVLAYFWPLGLPGGATDADKGFWLVQLVLIDGKFRGLFTLLFGASMMLFMERAWARGATRWLQARRLLWLAAFGLAHFFLVWTGDILFLYALSGLGALAMVKWAPRTQLRVGLAWFFAGSLALTVILGGQAAMEGVPRVQQQAPAQYEQVKKARAEMIARADKEAAASAEGSYGDVVAYRLAEETGVFGQSVFFALMETIPLMLVGMALYRMGLFERRFDPAKMRRWGWFGLIGGALLTLPIAWWTLSAGFPLMLTQFAFNGPVQFLHLPMVLGLAALLALWAPSAARTWLGSRFVAAGRMAFSNYLGTSLVMMLVFQGWAGGLYGRFHRPELALFVVVAWVLMLAWSKPWLARYRYGPLEWLWRCLTYGRLFPLRRRQSG